MSEFKEITTEPPNSGETIYGPYLPQMNAVMNELADRVARIGSQLKEELGMDPIEHCSMRIKSDESMREKCRKKGYPETSISALTLVHDAIGLRIVAAFVSDVYRIRDCIAAFEDCEIIDEKDYIRNAKPNGYRSLHLILRFQGKWYVEIQLRTISMDTWAALEHHMRYKKNLSENSHLIEAELKRCADELASTDLSMQTIRDMILES